MLAIFHSSGRAPWLKDLLKSVHKDVEITGADGKCLSREVSPSLRRCPHAAGIDRHLLGLKILAEKSGLPTPEIFTDPAWTKSGGDGNYILSTSLVGYIPVFGVTWPMVEDGYGTFYSIQDNRINVSVSAYGSSK
ncbi:Peroxisomal carnitine O-octanoyltransferase, partial [Paramuricea clavata]